MNTTALLKILSEMSDDELYETGKLITGIIAQRHSLRVLEGKEVRPGKRGVPWKRTDGTSIHHRKGKK